MKRISAFGVPAFLIAMALATAHAAASPRTSQVAAVDPTVKILVDRDGWYRISQATLTGLGVDPSNPNVHLSTGGQDVPYALAGGNFEFYGQGLDTVYSDTRTYWLSLGTTPGPRIQTVAAGGATNPPSGTFEATVKLRTRESYYGAVVNGIANNFFGNFVVWPTDPPVSRTLELPNADTSQNATLRVDLNGYSQTSHTVNVALNGTNLAPAMTGSGYAAMSRTFTVPVVAGQNTVTLTALGAIEPSCSPPSGGTIPDCSLTDEYTIKYRHFFMADDNALDFAPPSGAFSVGGFGTNDVRVADLTNPLNPQELTPTVSAPPGPHTIGITPPVGTTRLYAFTDAKVLAPKQVLQDTPSTLRTTGNQAHLIIISHADFKGNLQSLVNLRQAEGLNVDVVDVQDVYDEFGSSFGAKDPNAIREFLDYAKHFWTDPKPGYALLVGDASFDPRNYRGFGSVDFIPTIFVNAQFAPEPSADDSLADFTGDGRPELGLGRLPVRTAGETTAMVTKIVNYASNTPSGKTALLVADNFDRGDYQFDEFSDSLASTSLVPNGVAITKVYRPDNPPATGPGSDVDTHARVVAEANEGPTIVNWFGHGAIGNWAGTPPLLSVSDAPTMTNTTLSLYLMMTCQNAYFIDPTNSSLGERLLRAPSAAVAVWGSSGDTTPGDQVVAAKTATQQLFSDPTKRLGDVMIVAKAAVTDPDVLHTWTLLGDPTMKLRFSSPTAVSLKSFTAARADRGVALRWRTAAETNALGFNVYRFSGATKTKVNRGLIPAKRSGTARGAAYWLLDRAVPGGARAAYRLQVVTLAGTRVWAATARLRVSK